MDRRLWNEEELIRVLVTYCEIPFGQLHSRNPKIIELASRIDRTANAVALKMVNFASLDPTIDQRGMSNVSKLDREIWDKFFRNIDEYLSVPLEIEEKLSGFDEASECQFESVSTNISTEAPSYIISRRGQDRFRRAVLASYNYKCAISGLDDPALLVASHVAPWATNVGRRLDPRNGICLNSLLDKAFDTGVISISPDFKVLFSPKASQKTVEVISNGGLAFRKPERFVPDVELLREHAHRFGFM